MIKITNLTKKYGKITAVNGINLHIPAGEIFGFIGPNGAGKTTTIKMMAGLISPTSGKILLDGKDVSRNPLETKKVIGLIPDRPFLYEKLSGREFLRFIAHLFAMEDTEREEKIEKFLSLFELTDWGDELIESYSHGMKQKLVISAALIHNPKIIIVDEPIVGLDPKGAKIVKEIFKQLCLDKQVTIFMSTHILEVAEEMCHRIAIIQEGKLIAMGTPGDLRKMAGNNLRRLESIFLKLTKERETKDIIKVF